MKLEQSTRQVLATVQVATERLLTIDAQKLDAELRREVARNPLLEIEDVEADGGDAFDQLADAFDQIDDESPDDAPLAAPEPAFHDAALALASGEPTDTRDLALADLLDSLDDPLERDVAEWLVGELDEDGYLPRSPERMADEAAQRFGISPAGFASLRRVLMSRAPLGLGAADLRECLTIQLLLREGRVPGRKLALAAVALHLDAFLENPDSIADLLDIDAAQCAEVVALVKSCDPWPGASARRTAPRAIVPDLVARNERNGWLHEWQVVPHPLAAPKLKLSAIPARLLEQCGHESGALALRNLLRDARRLIATLAERQQLLISIAHAIVTRQRGFLERGERHLKPVAIEVVAAAVSIEPALVARALIGKSIETPRGVFPMSAFVTPYQRPATNVARAPVAATSASLQPGA